MKLLFLTHDTSRTGSPLVLLYFLQWLRQEHKEIELTILSIEGGVLAEEFKKNATKFYDLSEIIVEEKPFHQHLKKRILGKIGYHRRKDHPKDVLIEKVASENFDLIYANTVASVPLALKIKKLNTHVKLIVHVHELDSIISLIINNFKKYIPEIDRLIAASELVKENLIRNYNCEERKINLLYEFTKKFEVNSFNKKKMFLVGGAGTVHWRKGSDLFILVASHIKKKFPDLEIKFEWIGSISREQKVILEADLCKMGLNGMVSFVGSKDNPGGNYNNFDILLLPSREDPFPLVAIELGMLGKPIICFEKATGISEVLTHGGGTIVPYMDIEAMSEGVIQYYKNREKLKNDGDIAKKLFSEFTPENLCPKLFSIIKKEINE